MLLKCPCCGHEEDVTPRRGDIVSFKVGGVSCSGTIVDIDRGRYAEYIRYIVYLGPARKFFHCLESEMVIQSRGDDTIHDPTTFKL